MALIACLECGKRISSHAASCPECGCPVGEVPAPPAEPPLSAAPPVPLPAAAGGGREGPPPMIRGPVRPGQGRRGRPQPKPHEVVGGCVVLLLVALGVAWLLRHRAGGDAPAAERREAPPFEIPGFLSLACAADGESVFALVRDRSDPETIGYAIARHRLATGASETVARLGADADCLTLSPDGGTLAVAGGDDVRLLDTATWRTRWRLAKEEPYATGAPMVAFSPNGRGLAVTRFPANGEESSPRVVKVVDADSGRVRRYLVADRGSLDAMAVAFSPDGASVAAAGTEVRGGPLLSDTDLEKYRSLNWVALWREGRESPVWMLRGDPHKQHDPPTGLLFSRDGTLLTVAGGGRIVTYATSDGAVAHADAAEGAACVAVDSALGRLALFHLGIGSKSQVRVWDVGARRVIQEFPANDQMLLVGRLGAATFHPDGRRLLLGDRAELRSVSLMGEPGAPSGG